MDQFNQKPLEKLQQPLSYFLNLAVDLMISPVLRFGSKQANKVDIAFLDPSKVEVVEYLQNAFGRTYVVESVDEELNHADFIPFNHTFIFSKNKSNTHSIRWTVFCDQIRTRSQSRLMNVVITPKVNELLTQKSFRKGFYHFIRDSIKKITIHLQDSASVSCFASVNGNNVVIEFDIKKVSIMLSLSKPEHIIDGEMKIYLDTDITDSPKSMEQASL